MKPIERIKIPPLEPGTPSAVRKCAECKASIYVPLNLFNKLLECPSCHKGVLFKSRIDQAKETAGCLGCGLISLLALAVLTLLAGYVENPPWLHGWSPIVTRSKSNEAAPDAIALAEQAAAAVASERRAVTEQRELLEQMASMVPEQTAQVRKQVRILKSREDALTLKQRALEDLLAELRRKAFKNRN